MWIMNDKKGAIYSTDKYKRFQIQTKEDAVIIVCAENCDEKAYVLGRYFTSAEAKDVLNQLFEALINKKDYFEMPVSINLQTMERKHDARTKRKGGS